jgi:hypothetical protein
MANSREPVADGRPSTDERPDWDVIGPYLLILTLAGIVGLLLLAYLWLLRDEIIAVLRQAIN